MIVQEPVQAAIWHCLNNYDYSDAVFISERLYAEVKSDESLYLLATAYYRSGQKTLAYHTLKDKHGSSTQCQLLFGICAFDLEKYAEAESAIIDTLEGTTRTLEDVIVDFGEQSAFALMLLGKIGAKTERKPRAIEAWKKALKVNPYLFSAFESLCKIGENPNPTSIFQSENIGNTSLGQGQLINNIESLVITNLSPVPINTQYMTKSELIAETPPQNIISKFNPGFKSKLARDSFTPDESPLANPLCLSGFAPLSRHKTVMKNEFVETPSFGYLAITPENLQPTLTESNNHLPLGKRMRSDQIISRNNKDYVLQNSKPVFSQSSNVPVQKTPTIPLAMQPNQNVRRSSRLFSNFSSNSVKENNKSPTRNKFTTPKSPSRKTKQRLAKNINNKNNECEELNTKNKVSKNLEKSETITSDTKNEKGAINQNSDHCIQQAIQSQKQSAEGLCNLLRNIGQAYVALSSYDCQTAIQNLLALPANQFNTSWIYCLMGLAHFEMNDYESSIKYFKMVHEQDPYRLEYMDIYSTALWHLQKEVALSALAQDLMDTNRDHPVTYCVSGNCFSLHKEHDTAIKFFQRAVQVDSSFHYAYTLLGHEYITTEELDKAMCCFWNAVRINPMHYNAWFGIGTIYSKQERYRLAEMTYERALNINPQSSVIMCHIGIVQHALKRTDNALTTFNRAIANESKNPLCKFHRGSVYFALGRHAEALKELEELKEIVPTESSVYYLIGKVHKKLGNTDLALQHFSWATDLDPKGASSQIKEAFDPAMGRNNATDVPESPQSPTPEEYHSESNSGNQELEPMNFEGLPDDSEDSMFD
ncbi:unnamed protein product [Ceutorhynchus assimilis]|uniref:Cell division cycle protein 27 homolog n=1 Tax=Ceutorhynchus assimilis TaxID=467358 RepID=A0A9N9MT86_9CUCU|nr:unnamed protein product [Ceutorhynchus assimilis]